MSNNLRSIMENYLKEKETDCQYRNLHESIITLNISDVPVSAISKSEWEVVDSPQRLMRAYEFEEYPALKAFMDELMEYQEEVHHHAKLTVDYRKVIVEVYTHDINDITELDHDYAQTADAIYRDVLYYSYSDEVKNESRF